MHIGLKRALGMIIALCLACILLVPIVGARPGAPDERRGAEAPVVGDADATSSMQGVGGGGLTAQIVLQPDASSPGLVQDAHITEWYPDERWGTNGALQVRAPSGAIRTLIWWDLSTFSEIEVQNARLGLYAFFRSQDAGTWSFDVSAHAVRAPWAEGSVTWNHASQGVSWGQPGCNQLGVDRDAASVDTVSFTQNSLVQNWYEWDITPLVQAWIDAPEENYGLLLIASGDRVRYDFWSSEGSLPSLRPKLTIDYVKQEPTPTPTDTPTATPTPTFTPTSLYSPTPTMTSPPSATPTATSVIDDWIDLEQAITACCQPGSGCVFQGDTTGKPNNADFYGDGSKPPTWPYTGGEDVYIVHITRPGDLEVRLDSLSVDLDIFLLWGPHPMSLLDWHDRVIRRNLAPGTYYIVVDGFNDYRGPYTLTLLCSNEPTVTPTLTLTPTPTATMTPTNTPAYTHYPLVFRQSTPTPTVTPTPTETPLPSPTPTVAAYDVAVNCGSTQGYWASDGFYYQPDQPFAPGGWGYWYATDPCGHCVWSTTDAIAATGDDPLYQTHRYAMTTYTFTVPPGRYEVVLHFAEIFRIVSVDQRVFSVIIEGETVLNRFDMLAHGLRNRAGVKRFEVDVHGDVLNIGFRAESPDYAPAINAIRVSRIGG